MATVELTDLVTQYPNGVRGVDGVDLAIADGEFFALLGPSGCGKTTLLRTLAGLEGATEGRVRIGERDVTALEPGERDVAMVFQDYALFPHMTVSENIAYPLRIQKVARGEREERARESADPLSLGALLERRPAQLSGGQQQRVALARAIACHPQVFLFDEPLSNLDARLRLEARTFLKQLQRRLGVTTVFVTHDQAEALAMSDRMAVMEAGRIRQVGTPREVFQRPASLFVANFIGATPMNLLEGAVRGGRIDLGGVSVPLPAGHSGLGDGERVVWGVRPEYVATAGDGVPADEVVEGEVSAVENLGVTVLVTVAVGGRDGEEGVEVRAVLPEDDEPEVGARLRLHPQTARVLLYRADDDGALVEP
ncbi:ABC transporter ATP-binding protein [Phycicoccus sonneratiae]|uniref:ABC transporter ATP-binding protein n=1 Tax=Phycicoccus sonneratiae TaxID=2807628 RepID=A0ABS2CQQ1_9MICO|nr:ABC transporter ATP-binding protein [Phycicoccus sonneraticus]MBM6402215.1 ABC transporter ATP-binding protein [Phycicoccus sonneraticus]